MQACPRFVEFVEGHHRWSGVAARRSAAFAPCCGRPASTRLCSDVPHPLLTGVIQWVMGDDVVLVSSAEETAKDVYARLSAHDLCAIPAARTREHRFLATGDPTAFATGRWVLGPEIRGGRSAVEVVS